MLPPVLQAQSWCGEPFPLCEGCENQAREEVCIYLLFGGAWCCALIGPSQSSSRWMSLISKPTRCRRSEGGFTVKTVASSHVRSDSLLIFCLLSKNNLKHIKRASWPLTILFTTVFGETVKSRILKGFLSLWRNLERCFIYTHSNLHQRTNRNLVTKTGPVRKMNRCSSVCRENY